MAKWIIRVVLTVVVSVALAFAIAMLLVSGANAVPHQANVPVYTYGG
jgi:hypothetical protein